MSDMCPYVDECKQICHIDGDSYQGCARYQLARVSGIKSVPDHVGVLDYAKIPELIRAGK